MTGVAEKVINTSLQDGFDEGAIVTLAGSIGLTVILIRFDVAVLTEGQPLLDVRIHFTT